MQRKGLQGDFKGGTGIKNNKKKEDYKQIGMDSRKVKPVLCEYCNIRKGVEFHHIQSSYRGSRDNSPENLVFVCRHCHNEIHTKTGSTLALREKLSKIVLDKIK